MKVFNKQKTKQLFEYDLSKGYLKDDKIFIKHHSFEPSKPEKSHYEVIKEYPNGGKDVKKVIDSPYIKAKEPYDEYEEIKIYIPYTDDEIKKISEDNYRNNVTKFIREKYSLSDELALLRQRDSKKDEFEEYYEYVENCKIKAKKLKVEN